MDSINDKYILFNYTFDNYGNSYTNTIPKKTVLERFEKLKSMTDDVTALKVLGHAYEYGIHDGMYYERGTGEAVYEWIIEKDLSKSKEYYEKAMRLFDIDSFYKINELSPKLHREFVLELFGKVDQK